MGFGRVIEGFIMYMQGLGSRVCCDEALKQISNAFHNSGPQDRDPMLHEIEDPTCSSQVDG